MTRTITDWEAGGGYRVNGYSVDRRERITTNVVLLVDIQREPGRVPKVTITTRSGSTYELERPKDARQVEYLKRCVLEIKGEVNET